MKIKTSDLIGPALDWAVWHAAGGTAAYPKTAGGKAFLKLWRGKSVKYVHPTTDWSQGGPIIERENSSLDQREDEPCRAYIYFNACEYLHAMFAPNKQPLVAAMRCVVASKLGDEVEVPKELT